MNLQHLTILETKGGPWSALWRNPKEEFWIRRKPHRGLPWYPLFLQLSWARFLDFPRAFDKPTSQGDEEIPLGPPSRLDGRLARFCFPNLQGLPVWVKPPSRALLNQLLQGGISRCRLLPSLLILSHHQRSFFAPSTNLALWALLAFRPYKLHLRQLPPSPPSSRHHSPSLQSELAMVSPLLSLSLINPPLPYESTETSELHSFLECLSKGANLVSLLPFFLGSL